MILNNNYVEYSENIESYSICSYRNILTKFVNVFIHVFKNTKDVHNKSIIYGKYYLFYKTLGCEYNKEIMNVINDVEFIINKKQINKLQYSLQDKKLSSNSEYLIGH
jgi:hypothetical protein